MSRQTAWLAALFHLTSSSAASARRAAYLRMVFELIAFTAVWQVEQRREVPVAKPNLKAQSHRLPVRIGESSDQPDLALGKSDRKQPKIGRRMQPRLLPITQCTVGGSQEFWLRARPERRLRRRLRASTVFPLPIFEALHSGRCCVGEILVSPGIGPLDRAGPLQGRQADEPNPGPSQRLPAGVSGPHRLAILSVR